MLLLVLDEAHAAAEVRVAAAEVRANSFLLVQNKTKVQSTDAAAAPPQPQPLFAAAAEVRANSLYWSTCVLVCYCC
jgi:hypothetical protein